MNIQNGRTATNLSVKVAPNEESILIDFLPKPEYGEKKYNSELEVYIHYLNQGNFIGIYVHSPSVRIDNALYAAEREVSHKFTALVEQLNAAVENTLKSADLTELLSCEKASSCNLSVRGVHSYLISQEHEEEVRKALHPYWK